jgi:O-antigen ligase
MQPVPLPARAEQLARHAAAFLGFSIPISVALDNVLLALVALLWLAGGDYKRKLADIAANPVALAALALFGMLIVGLSYGVGPRGDGIRYLGKYSDLVFIPIFITLFRDTRTREVALRWFCVAMILSFAVAEVAASGLLVANPLLNRTPGHAFKFSITHGLLSAYAAFAFALLATREPRGPLRLLFAVLALVAVKNAVAIGISRTGYLVLALLAIYISFAYFRWRGLAAAALALVLAFSAAYWQSEHFRERIDTLVVDKGDWNSQWPSRESVNLRAEWYRHSLDVVVDHPILGVGTGSFPKVLAEKQAGGAVVYPPNPHNEYLAIAMQTGLIGLVLLLHLFWRQWAVAPRLASPLETHLARGLVITLAVGCLFNSLLLDHTEGLLYAWFTGLLFGGLRPRSPPGSGGVT